MGEITDERACAKPMAFAFFVLDFDFESVPPIVGLGVAVREPVADPGSKVKSAEHGRYGDAFFVAVTRHEFQREPGASFAEVRSQKDEAQSALKFRVAPEFAQ